MKPGLLRNIASHYFGLAIAGTANFLLVPVLLHCLGVEGYGILAVCLSAVTVLQFLEFGMTGAAVKYVAQWRTEKNDEKLRYFFKTGLLFFGLLGLIGGLILVGLSAWIPVWLHVGSTNFEAARRSLLWTSAALFCSFPNMILKSYLVGKQRYDLSNTVEASIMLLYAGLAAILASTGQGVASIAAAYAVSSVFGFVLLVFLVFREFPQLKHQSAKFRMTIFQDVWRFSFWNFIRNIASRISWDLDTFIIGAFLSTGSVTPYSVGRKLPYIYSGVSWRWVDVFFPLSSEMYAEGRQQELRTMFVRASRWCLAISLAGALFLIFLAHPLLILWLGNATRETVLVQQLVTLSLFFDLSHSVSVTMLAGSGKLKRISQYFLAEAILNLALSLILVQRLGIVGVALATTIASSSSVLLLQIPYACRNFEIKISMYIREVWLPQLYPSIVAIGVFVLTGGSNYVTAIVGGFIAIAAYGALFWFFGASIDDRMLIRSSFQISSVKDPRSTYR